jgi:polyhydroxyalkanoate synthase
MASENSTTDETNKTNHQKENFSFYNNNFSKYNYEELDPQVQKTLNDLSDFYTKVVTNFTNIQPSALNIFEPEIVGKAFAESHKVTVDQFLSQPETWDQKQQEYLQNIEELFKRTINKLHGNEEEPIIIPHKDDRRFKASEWNEFPVFDYIKQSYLLHTSYINDIIESLDGIEPKTKEKIQFYTKSLMNAFSPTNFPMTNPEVWKEIIKTQGQNILKGYKKLLDDNAKSNFLSLPMFTDLNAFELGKNLATTEGKVIFETPLFQLIYYKPTQEKSYEIPLLIVPPWINKYYIFDLQEEKSFVKWALDNGISTFVLSWINPDETYAECTMQDYVIDGVLKAIEHTLAVTKQEKLNLLAYCTGGVAATLLAGYVAKRIEKNPLASLTLLASPVDFEKMGELKVFVCEEQLDHMEKHIKDLGYLPGDAIVKVFSMLRANDLIWGNYVNTYLLNKDPFPMDFLYWNCDATHVPATMHLEYLRHIFLENRLMHPNSFHIDGVGIDLKEINIPKFVFATKNDHIVPWQSAFAIKEFCKDNTKFVLGAAGHVAGIINPPKNNKYCYWISSKKDSHITNPDQWLEQAKKIDGSWWNEWKKWNIKFSGNLIEQNLWEETPCIEKAPGRYATSSKPKN